jgi:hypothetical protein
MASNGPEFNAPSREAIYNRIHKLAYGYDWVYDYESFVEYDMRNIEEEKARNAAPSMKRSHIKPIRHQKPFLEIEKTTSPDGENIIRIIMN